jgi:signal transduction histidine kinase
MRPRSLGARLFVAIACVSAIAFALGVWLMDRALRIEVRESVTVTRPSGGAPRTDTRREVTEAPGSRVLGGPLRQRVLMALALVVAGAALVTAWLVRRIVRPVSALREATERLARGDRGARVGTPGRGAGGPSAGGGDELAALGQAFDHMADRLDAIDRQRRDLTNDVAHELRTPLTNLRCHLEALTEGVTPFTPDAAQALLDDVGHLQRIVDDLADLARADAGQLALSVEAVALAPAVAGLARVMHARLAAAGVTLQVEDLAPMPLLRADPARLTQVLRNLLENAVTHTPRGGVIRVSASPGPGRVGIVVADSGPGIPAEHLGHVFDRFYRTDPSRTRATGGAGLGLAIVRQIVELHGGRVRVTSPPGSGAAFAIDWPVFIESSQSARLIDP